VQPKHKLGTKTEKQTILQAAAFTKWLLKNTNGGIM